MTRYYSTSTKEELSLKKGGRIYPSEKATYKKVLMYRWYDRQLGKWTEWEDIQEPKLSTKYGKTPTDWKRSCKTWLSVGGLYQYKIVQRTDETIWEDGIEDEPEM